MEKFNKNLTGINMEEEEKSEFLKREEIRTMAKDMVQIREDEAQKEREKIAGLDREETEKKEKPKDNAQEQAPETIESQETPAAKESTKDFSEKILIPKKPPRKPSPFVKIVTRLLIVLIFLSLTGAIAYWFLEIKKTQESPFLIVEEKVIKEEPTDEGEVVEENLEESILEPEDELKEAEPEIPEIKTQEPTINKMIIDWGYYEPDTPRVTDTIIIHSCYDSIGSDPYSLSGILDEFRAEGVALHYFIDRQSAIHQLILDKMIAYHVGKSAMPDGSRKDTINNFSIGIGLIYKENESPDENQYQTLANLTNYLVQKHSIPVKNILGHYQVSPGRRVDPLNFDWQKFNQMLN